MFFDAWADLWPVVDDLTDLPTIVLPSQRQDIVNVSMIEEECGFVFR